MMLSGGEVAVKLAGSAAKNAAAMLLALARNHKKVYGKTSLKKILQQTRDIRTFSLTPEQYREFSRQAKAHSWMRMSSRGHSRTHLPQAMHLSSLTSATP